MPIHAMSADTGGTSNRHFDARSSPYKVDNGGRADHGDDAIHSDSRAWQAAAYRNALKCKIPLVKQCSFIQGGLCHMCNSGRKTLVVNVCPQFQYDHSICVAHATQFASMEQIVHGTIFSCPICTHDCHCVPCNAQVEAQVDMYEQWRQSAQRQSSPISEENLEMAMHDQREPRVQLPSNNLPTSEPIPELPPPPPNRVVTAEDARKQTLFEPSSLQIGMSYRERRYSMSSASEDDAYHGLESPSSSPLYRPIMSARSDETMGRQNGHTAPSAFNSHVSFCCRCLATFADRGAAVTQCNRCPRSFHRACLSKAPLGMTGSEWHCPECKNDQDRRHFKAALSQWRRLPEMPHTLTLGHIVYSLLSHEFGRAFFEPELSSIQLKIHQGAYVPSRSLNRVFLADIRHIWAKVSKETSARSRTAAILSAGFESLVKQITGELK
ncbi:hypothetical protein Ae201684_008732 [Aphanomyces euteiches]|uniref:PHD-type domain-containing protein n=1 Tax=Aphanomyces euteiches TaxID=100861 RepID=A0A6G0X4B1_9STRA|nr:hypothetical protein Ae201684_008732 [Aphanomyces euteiches]